MRKAREGGRGFLWVAMFTLFFSTLGWAEGTKEIEPQAQYTTKFKVGNNGTGGFDSDSVRKIYVSVKNPSTEVFYFGFGHVYKGNDPFGSATPAIYRIVDPAGNVVHGPFSVPTTSAGYIATHAQAVAGPVPVAGASGYTPISFNPQVAGDYSIEFSEPGNPPNSRIGLRYFDMTVYDTAQMAAQLGRMYAYTWGLNSSNFQDSSYAAFYVYTPDSVVTRFSLNGMQAFGFNVFCNDYGPLKIPNNVVWSRKSVNSSAVGQQFGSKYRLFLNNPDTTLYPSRSVGANVTSPITINGCPALGYCIDINLNRAGQAEVYLDLNGTPGYQRNTRDRLIEWRLDQGYNCVPWDGKDGLGNTIPDSTTVSVNVGVLAGLTHFPINDPENNVNGIKVDIVRPFNKQPKVFWDDRLVGGGLNLTGCTGTCHSWSNFLGNNKVMNTWWYTDREDTVLQFMVINNCPPEAVDDLDSAAEGQSITYHPLDNDSDPDGNLDSSSIAVIQGPANGTFTQNGYQIIYTPNPNFICYDTLTYIIRDTGPTQTSDSDSVYTDTAYMIAAVLPDTPQVSTPGPYGFCQSSAGDTLLALPQDSNYVAQWFASEDSQTPLGNPFVLPTNMAGTFHYYAAQRRKDASCFGFRERVRVEVQPRISSAFGIVDTVFCAPSSLQYTLQPLNLGGTFSTEPVTPGGPVANLSGRKFTPDLVGSYDIIHVINKGSCPDSTRKRITVLPDLEAKGDTSICSGTTITIGTTDTLSAVDYSWTGTLVGLANPNSAQTNVTVNLGSPNPLTLNYVLEANYQNGTCLKRDTVTVTVNPTPQPNTQLIGPTQVCEGRTGITYAIANPSANLNWNWSVTGGTIAQDFGDSIRVDWTNPQASNGVFATPVNVNTGCVGNLYSLNVALNTTHIPEIELVQGINDSICGTERQGVLYTVENAVPGATYTWNVINGQVQDGLDSSTAAIDWDDTATNGYVSVTIQYATSIAICSGTSDLELIELLGVPDSMNVSLEGPASACQGETIWYELAGSADSAFTDWEVLGGQIVQESTDSLLVEWTSDSSGEIRATQYYAHQQVLCLSKTFGQKVKVNPLPEIRYSQFSGTVCRGSAAGQEFRLAGEPGTSYEWTLQGGSIQEQDSLGLRADFTGLAERPVLTVRATNAAGCVRLRSDTLSLDQSRAQLHSLGFQLGVDSLLNFNFTMQRTQDSVSAGMPALFKEEEGQWIPLEEVAYGDTGLTWTFPADANVFSTYRLLGFDACGDSLFSAVHEPIDLQVDSGQGAGTQLQWTAYQGWTTGVAYYEVFRRVDSSEWRFYAEVQPPALSVGFNNAGDGFEQCYQLRAVHSDGRVSWSDVACVQFSNPLQVYNVMTPNGDTKNATFYIEHIGLYPGTEVQVFNRWGKEVFHSRDYQNDWTGEEMPSGTYFYYIRWQKQEKRGYLEIIR